MKRALLLLGQGHSVQQKRTDRSQDGGGVVKSTGEFPLASRVMRRSFEYHELHQSIIFVDDAVAVHDHALHFCVSNKTKLVNVKRCEKMQIVLTSEHFGVLGLVVRFKGVEDGSSNQQVRERADDQ